MTPIKVLTVPARDKRNIIATRLKDSGFTVNKVGMELHVEVSQIQSRVFQHTCAQVLGSKRKVFIFDGDNHDLLIPFRNALSVIGMTSEWNGNGQVSVNCDDFQEETVLKIHNRICPDVPIKKNKKVFG